jgi:enamine deaminase RidA (YjgF/YER057c/UK114 family)
MTVEAQMPPTHVQHINPPGLHSNPAYTQVVTVDGPVRTVYVGGQNAVNANGEIVGDDIAAQTRQVLHNIELALAGAGARWEHVIKMNLLLAQGQPVQPGFEVWQQVWGSRPNPPLITAAIVAGLAHPQFLLEIDALAVVPQA